MKILSRIVVVLAVALLGGAARASEGVQVTGEAMKLAGGQVVFTLNLPAVLPTLVVIQPGVSVIPNQDVEVFYSGGYYWTRRDAYWYRTRDHNGGWARIDDRNVPVVIARSPPGQYRHYDGKGHGNGKGKGHDEEKPGNGHGKPDKHGGDHE